MCALLAGIAAYLQKLQGPMLVAAALVYYAFLFFGGAKYILPMFGLRVKVAQSDYTTLNINGNEG
jgi:uncharacterized membrane protein